MGSCSEASVCDDNVLENNKDPKNLKPLINRANKIRNISEKYFGDTCDSTTVTNEDRREQHGVNSGVFERQSSDHIFRCPILERDGRSAKRRKRHKRRERIREVGKMRRYANTPGGKGQCSFLT